MKQLILATLNSKYIHTNLALRTLKANCYVDNINTTLCEYSINDHDIFDDLYMRKGDIYAFSCYIWNIEQTLKLVHTLKLVLPQCTIILGGPEVSYAPIKYIKKSFADIVVIGEGEKTFQTVLQRLVNCESLHDVSGIFYRTPHAIKGNPHDCSMLYLDEMVFPYQFQELDELSDRILYYESSRGCPFQCSYCLSSIDGNVRFLSLERVKAELSLFMDKKVKQVKFVDRTFNCNKSRSMEIFKFIIDNHNGYTNFHFEIAVDLMDEEIIHLLKQAPLGSIQLEIGVQSTHLPTLEAINRKTDINKITSNVAQLRSCNNIHLHLDLIVGLPYEDLDIFKSSFNDVYSMQPHMLQVGFLKLLKGSPIEQQKEKYGYIFNPYPPFDIFSNKYMDYDTVLFLKQIAYLVEKYYNSGAFHHTLKYVIKHYYKDAYTFFESLQQYWLIHDLYNQALSKKSVYKELYTFLLQLKDASIPELLKLDYLLNNKWPVPLFLFPNELPKEEVFNLLKKSDFVENYLPQYVQRSPKEIYKNVYVQNFYHILKKDSSEETSTVLFYRSTGNSLDQINEYRII